MAISSRISIASQLEACFYELRELDYSPLHAVIPPDRATLAMWEVEVVNELVGDIRNPNIDPNIAFLQLDDVKSLLHVLDSLYQAEVWLLDLVLAKADPIMPLLENLRRNVVELAERLVVEALHK